MKFISLSSEQLFKTDQPNKIHEHIKRAFIVYLSDWYREKNKKRP
jgi:hypothetical protein